MINERAYFQSLDPYESEEFEPCLIEAFNGITGIPIAKVETHSLEEIQQFVVDMVTARHVHSDAITLHILNPRWRGRR